MSTASGLIALSADRAKRWRLHISNRDGSLLQGLQFVEVTGQPALSQFDAMHAARALQITQALLGIMPVQAREQVCKDMANGKLRAFELKGCAFQVLHSALYFCTHYYRFSNSVSNYARWRPRLLFRNVNGGELIGRYSRLTDVLRYKIFIAAKSKGSCSGRDEHGDLSPATQPGMQGASEGPNSAPSQIEEG